MYKFTEEIIESNKQKYIDLLKQIKREGAKVDELIAKIENSDWFVAPASTKYHNNIKGGLVDHSLNVYYNLKSLIKNKHLEEQFDEDSIIICGLLHDMSKMNFYEINYKNVKVYKENGSKYDDNGRFDWESKQYYTTRPIQDRFVFANHEATAEFMVSKFIPLTVDESMAIINHHGGTGFDSAQNIIGDIYHRSKLATLLHLADMLATFVDEDINYE